MIYCQHVDIPHTTIPACELGPRIRANDILLEAILSCSSVSPFLGMVHGVLLSLVIITELPYSLLLTPIRYAQ